MSATEDNLAPFRPEECMAFVWTAPEKEESNDDDDDAFGRIMDSHIRMNRGRLKNV